MSAADLFPMLVAALFGGLVGLAIVAVSRVLLALCDRFAPPMPVVRRPPSKH